MYDLICILGPTATGKTRLAAILASFIKGEIISADSRQVYRNMNIGTGKDYKDYIIEDKQIPYHLIDLVPAGVEYNVYQYKNDFYKAYSAIKQRSNIPILCGGTGMYLESILKNYNLVKAPLNSELRESLKNKTFEELKTFLISFSPNIHNTTDTLSRDRLLRAIEIKEYSNNIRLEPQKTPLNSIVFGIKYERTKQRERISERLKIRLNEGMIKEVEDLILLGTSVDRLLSYGLEYRYITQYILKQLSYKDMYRLLEIAIHQFAKRQMTWFRRMEQNGINIHWIDGELDMNIKISQIIKLIKI